MKIIAVYNIKGGVGKTATAVNLSYLSAKNGDRTLLCDLDPQGASSYYLRVERKNGVAPKKFWQGGKSANKRIRSSKYENLDVLPADETFRNLDLFLDKQKKSRSHVGRFLERFQKSYDTVIVDAPPNLTLLSENLFKGSDIILVPLIPTTLSLRTFSQIKAFFEEEKLPTMKLRAFFSMVEMRKKMHQDIIDQSPGADGVFIPVDIPMAAVVEKMGVYREPVPVYAPDCPAVTAYHKLWAWLNKSI